MSEGQSKQSGLKMMVFGLHVTIFGLAIDPGYPLLLAGLVIAATGFAIE